MQDSEIRAHRDYIGSVLAVHACERMNFLLTRRTLAITVPYALRDAEEAEWMVAAVEFAALPQWLVAEVALNICLFIS